MKENKTPEEVLQEHFGTEGYLDLRGFGMEKKVIAAMEEYADQFQSPRLEAIKPEAEERLKNRGVQVKYFHHAIGYTDSPEKMLDLLDEYEDYQLGAHEAKHELPEPAPTSREGKGEGGD